MTDLKWNVHPDGHGQGGFLSPPGHPDHTYVVEGKRRRARHPDVVAGVGSVLAHPDEYPAEVVEWARVIMDGAELVASEMWVRSVYGYFKNMWSTTGQMWDRVDQLVGTRSLTEPLPADHHAAAIFVRQWFPDHEPRVDLIKNTDYCYGAYACIKCGHGVQYEARQDALCRVHVPRPEEIGEVPWRWDAVCPADGGAHEWPPRPDVDEEEEEEN